MDLQDARVLLTGGSRGIGPYIARALLARGARVMLVARSAEDLERTRTELGGDRVATAAGDVSDPGDRRRVVAAAEEAFGPIDVLVNNAAVEWVRHFPDYDQEQIRSMVSINLEAPIQLAHLVVPGMVDRGRGHVVNVSSVAGKAAVPYNVVYTATKHGLVGFSYSLRAELHGTGVSASVICPGYVLEAGLFAEHHLHTSTPKGGTGTTPQKVAAAVVRAIERDKPDVVVAGFLPKLSDVSFAISPSFSMATARRIGGYDPMLREAEARRKQAAGGR